MSDREDLKGELEERVPSFGLHRLTYLTSQCLLAQPEGSPT